MNGKLNNRGGGLLLVILAIAVALLCGLLGWNVMGAKAAGIPGSYLEEFESGLTGLYSCVKYADLSPRQDSEFPPEGYHCRLFEGKGLENAQASAGGNHPDEGLSVPPPAIVTEPPAATETESPTEISTEEPTLTSTPEPPAGDPTKTPDPEPWTPTEKSHPNAGRGNGSEIDPNTGEDLDPGNSGRNRGGD